MVTESLKLFDDGVHTSLFLFGVDTGRAQALGAAANYDYQRVVFANFDVVGLNQLASGGLNAGAGSDGVEHLHVGALAGGGHQDGQGDGDGAFLSGFPGGGFFCGLLGRGLGGSFLSGRFLAVSAKATTDIDMAISRQRAEQATFSWSYPP